MTTLINGQKILDGVFQGGSAALPSVRFANSLTDGFYYIGANNLGLALNGIKTWDYTTVLSSSITPLAFSAGIAVTATSYQVGRDADATNQLHLNVPTGAGYELSVNDVAQMTLSATAVNFISPTTWTDTALGTTTVANISLVNSTAAANGAQQVSPSLKLTGYGWETTTSTSDAVDWQAYVLPVQGTAASSKLVFQSQENAGGWNDRMTLTSLGYLSATRVLSNGLIDISSMAEFVPNYAELGGAATDLTIETYSTGTAINLASATADGASAVAVRSGSKAAYSTAGAKLHSFVNDTTEKAYIDKDGDVVTVGSFSSTMTSQTLAEAATTFIAANDVIKITGDAGGNTVATITGGRSGQRLTLIFVDALVTLTDTAAATADTVNLSAAFTSSADDTITLIYDANKWFEVSRSTN